MTDQNTALALELEEYLDARPVGMEQARLLRECVAALRTPAPAPVAVGGDVMEQAREMFATFKGWGTGSLFWGGLREGLAKGLFDNDDAMRAIVYGLQAQPTASTAQPVSGDWFNPETHGTDCPSCGGQNISCPDGCGRDPEAGELNGTRLETAQPDDVVERVAKAIYKAAYAHCCNGETPEPDDQNWQSYTIEARAALAAMQQQAPVADDVRTGDLLDIDAARLALFNAIRSIKVGNATDDKLILNNLRDAGVWLSRLSTQPQPDAAVAVEQWQPIETAPLDGSDIVILANEMEIEARFSPGEWSEDTPISPAEYTGPVWVGFDDAVQFEIEETPDGFWHGPVTHWKPKTPLPTAAIRAGGQP